MTDSPGSWPAYQVAYRLDALNWPRPGVRPPPGPADPLRAEVVRLLARIPLDFGGGCSASKAYLMAALIRALPAKASLDIGVYRGRSLLPQALAHRMHTGGMAFGVDPWSKEAAREDDHPALKAQIDRFVETTDFDALYRDVDALRHSAGVAAHCTLVRQTSAAAAELFRQRGQRFGLIHIDGNHDTAPVMRDVDDYLPLLEPGGILVMDDVSWDSVKPACARVAEHLQRLFTRTDPLNDYAVYADLSRYPGGAPPWLALLRDEFIVRG